MSSAAKKTDQVTFTPLPGAGPRTGSFDKSRDGSRTAAGGTVAGNGSGTAGENSFVAGPENKLVSAVMNRIVTVLNTSNAEANAGAFNLPSPLVLSGASGSGKTHLARGIFELWQQKRGGSDAAYYTAGDFGRALAAAIHDGNVRDFRRQHRRLRLLVIDEAHRLGDTAARASELQHTLDAFEQSGGLLMLTMSTSWTGAVNFGRPLLSRLAGGLTLEIAPPGKQARRELLRQATVAAGCTLDEEALDTLAQELPAEPPKVIRAAAELRRRQGVRVDAPAAKRLIDSERPATSPPLRDILRVVARYHQIPLRVLTSASRKQGVVAARAVAIYLARELTPLSYAQIGQSLGGRDHTTVMHSYRRIDRELAKDRALQSAVEDLKRLLVQ